MDQTKESGIVVGELHSDEWEAYKALRLEALKLEPQAFGASYERSLILLDTQWKERLEIAVSPALQWLVFAKRDGVLVGIAGAGVGEEPEIAEIYSVYVKREARGRGVSKMLMHALFERIEHHPSIRYSSLMVNQDQAAAVALYRGLGYEVVRQEDFKMGDGQVHTQLVMRKSINGSTPESESPPQG